MSVVYYETCCPPIWRSTTLPTLNSRAAPYPHLRAGARLSVAGPSSRWRAGEPGGVTRPHLDLMSEEIDRGVTKVYEVAQKLGKGAAALSASCSGRPCASALGIARHLSERTAPVILAKIANAPAVKATSIAHNSKHLGGEPNSHVHLSPPISMYHSLLSLCSHLASSRHPSSSTRRVWNRVEGR